MNQYVTVGSSSSGVSTGVHWLDTALFIMLVAGTPSRPEFIDAPHYTLEVELQFPNLAPMTARAIQPVPLSRVPNLAIGLKLDCVVDPADPSRRFAVDWPQL